MFTKEKLLYSKNNNKNYILITVLFVLVTILLLLLSSIFTTTTIHGEIPPPLIDDNDNNNNNNNNNESSGTIFSNTTLNQEVICSTYTSCGECTSHLECGYCVTTGECVQGSWDAPFKNPLCSKDNLEYEFAQCFVTHKQILISAISALFGMLFLSIMLCVCCCLCRCFRGSGCGGNTGEESSPLIQGDTLATNHFRRASFYNYNRNRPFERRSRTVSIGTANNLSQIGRNWRTSTFDEYVYGGGYGYNYGGYYGYGNANGYGNVGYGANGYSGPTNASVLWDNNDSPDVSPPISTSTTNSATNVNGNNNVSNNNNSNDFLSNNSYGNTEWRRWEKKRSELLTKYAKSTNNE